MIKELEQLEKMLQDYDWYFAMSDDHSVWREGYRKYRIIKSLYDTLVLAHKGDEATEVWNKYAPKEFKRL